MRSRRLDYNCVLFSIGWVPESFSVLDYLNPFQNFSFADGIGLICDDSKEMKGALKSLENYCRRKQLVINVPKTKILTFGKGRPVKSTTYLLIASKLLYFRNLFEYKRDLPQNIQKDYKFFEIHRTKSENFVIFIKILWIGGTDPDPSNPGQKWLPCVNMIRRNLFSIISIYASLPFKTFKTINHSRSISGLLLHVCNSLNSLW